MKDDQGLFQHIVGRQQHGDGTMPEETNQAPREERPPRSRSASRSGAKEKADRPASLNPRRPCHSPRARQYKRAIGQNLGRVAVKRLQGVGLTPSTIRELASPRVVPHLEALLAMSKAQRLTSTEVYSVVRALQAHLFAAERNCHDTDGDRIWVAETMHLALVKGLTRRLNEQLSKATTASLDAPMGATTGDDRRALRRLTKLGDALGTTAERLRQAASDLHSAPVPHPGSFDRPAQAMYDRNEALQLAKAALIAARM